MKPKTIRERTSAYVEAELERDLDNDLTELASAEDFLNYFQVPFDISVVQVNRLHILQRFHNYLAAHDAGKKPAYETYQKWLALAYEDFTKSTAIEERVFSVLQRATGTSYVSLDGLRQTA